jgi:hypothetical protein
VVEEDMAGHKESEAPVVDLVADPVGVSVWAEAADCPMVLSRFLSLLARYWRALFVAVVAAVAHDPVSWVVAVDDPN